MTKLILMRRGSPSVAVGREDRAYVIHGRVMEGIIGNEGREWLIPEEVKSENESKEDTVWIFVFP
ncbi:hypothetical protein MANES_14G087201v8 [Manihot esculenta]|uniref:Uncharacterized protein n=1 Tax=Manihot esculenta TaxID=3983 RepID=A0ACB7GJR1_MANES|nr:hypothetical protein MANES_14G087201v8 [Manihot esculenta]